MGFMVTVRGACRAERGGSALGTFVVVVKLLGCAGGSDTEAGFSEMLSATVVTVVVVVPTRVTLVRGVGVTAATRVRALAPMVDGVFQACSGGAGFSSMADTVRMLAAIGSAVVRGGAVGRTRAMLHNLVRPDCGNSSTGTDLGKMTPAVGVAVGVAVSV